MHRSNEKLHLKLKGDFDGSSAWELIHALKEHSNGAHRVFIDTSGLKNVLPFGREVFHSNLSELKGRDLNLVFIGSKAEQITMDRCALRKEERHF
jgi:hypothetical protein